MMMVFLTTMGSMTVVLMVVLTMAILMAILMMAMVPLINSPFHMKILFPTSQPLVFLSSTYSSFLVFYSILF
jgi:hypothetical protein